MRCSSSRDLTTAAQPQLQPCLQYRWAPAALACAHRNLCLLYMQHKAGPEQVTSVAVADDVLPSLSWLDWGSAATAVAAALSAVPISTCCTSLRIPQYLLSVHAAQPEEATSAAVADDVLPVLSWLDCGSAATAAAAALSAVPMSTCCASLRCPLSASRDTCTHRRAA